jgi:hypothetical protein
MYINVITTALYPYYEYGFVVRSIYKIEGVVMKQALKLLLLISIAALMTACKLAVIVVEGGEVQATEGGELTVSDICMEGTICIVEVNDTNFNMKFYAIPDAGWYFEKWNSGDRLFCADSTTLGCKLSLTAAKGNAGIETLVASPETFYLMPVFKPHKDTIIVDDKQWFQPHLFLNLSWHDINAVCPKGICAGVLNGYDMTGWLWASVNDINTLFNYYIGAEILGPGPSSPYLGEAPNSTWASDFYSDGWGPTNDRISPFFICRSTEGWTSDEAIQNCSPDCHYTPHWSDADEDVEGFICSDNATTEYWNSSNGYWGETGAWFYRALQ